MDGPPRVCLVQVRPVAATALVRGAVVWAQVPFRDGDGWKTRPAVVVRTVGRDVTVLPLGSSARAWRTPGVVAIRRWVEAGLSRPCVVRGAPVTIDRMEVLDIVGHLHDDDLVVAA